MWWSLLLIAGGVWVCIYANVCAYRNGVNDGYGYSREPKNPGYQRAGHYLRRYCAHRWQELREIPPERAEDNEPPPSGTGGGGSCYGGAGGFIVKGNGSSAAVNSTLGVCMIHGTFGRSVCASEPDLAFLTRGCPMCSGEMEPHPPADASKDK